MTILHVVPGLTEPANGIAVAAKLIAEGQHREGHEVDLIDTKVFVKSALLPSSFSLLPFSEIWVHSMWQPTTLRACLRVLKFKRGVNNATVQPSTFNLQPQFVRMPHGCLDPVRLNYHGWKKRLMSPIERWLLRRSDRIVATCEAEADWIRNYLTTSHQSHRSLTIPSPSPKIEIIDFKRFFNLQSKVPNSKPEIPRSLHVLYLGRRHPLKGVEYLEQAIKEINKSSTVQPPTSNLQPKIDLHIVSDHHGEDLERDWDWCDVLCLPTLSENFGLVIAEALERGKRVITTDGAPAWEPDEEVDSEEKKSISNQQLSTNRSLVYLRGYRDGSDRQRIGLLKDALAQFLGGPMQVPMASDHASRSVA